MEKNQTFTLDFFSTLYSSKRKKKEKKKLNHNVTMAKDDMDAQVWSVTAYAYGCPQSRVDTGLSFPRLEENEEERCAERSLQDIFVRE